MENVNTLEKCDVFMTYHLNDFSSIVLSKIPELSHL